MKKILILSLCIFLLISAIAFIPKFIQTKPSIEQDHSLDTYAKGDVNQDNTVDELDRVIVRKGLNCKASDSCWNTVIGETRSGNNPIYVKDVDLNKDKVVDQKDVDEVK